MESPCLISFPSAAAASAAPSNAGPSVPPGPPLSALFWDWYLPLVLVPTESSRLTVQADRDVVNRWARWSGDPPISQITSRRLTEYAQQLSQSAGRKGETLSRFTVRRHLGTLCRLLAWCGPSGAEDREGLVWLATPPRVRMPPAPRARCQGAFSIEEFQSLLRAAAGLPEARPCRHSAFTWHGCRWPDWWRAALLVMYLEGLRIGTLLGIEYGHLAPREGFWVLDLPDAICKRGRGRVLPLHPASVEAIESIRSARAKIFGVAGYAGRWAYAAVQKDFVALCRRAGVRCQRYRGFHGLRKLHGTTLWRQEGAAAKLSLGHAQIDTTQLYVEEEAAIAGLAAVKSQLPVPELGGDRQLLLF